MSRVAYIALGSNLGDPIAIVQSAFEQLQSLSQTPVVRSSLWRSTPVDCPEGSPDFINAVAGIIPIEDETPESLLVKLKALEMEAGRRPKVVMNEPRPLDLDLISFGEVQCGSTALTLPHPRFHERRFVLAPLAEIAPEDILPGQTQTVTVLLAALKSDEILSPL